MKLDDDYEEYEEWNREEDPEEAGEAVKPVVKVLVFLGLVAVAAIICAILWNVTHRGDPSEDPSAEQTKETVQEEESKEDSKEDSGEDTETIPEDSPESSPVPIPESSPESSSETVPESAEAPGEEPEASASDVADNGGTEQNPGVGGMAFTECQDTVTPKEVINLRSAPTTGQADNIVTQAANGELLSRTGVNNDTGWSRLDYNGQILYAVSRYLTTDLTYQPPAAEPDPNMVNTKDGRTITFTDCDDNISPKEYVNLRLEPSTSEGNDTVHCRLEYGEVVHRTGISESSGWSRVEYDGLVLYVVTSYMYVVEEPQDTQ